MHSPTFEHELETQKSLYYDVLRQYLDQNHQYSDLFGMLVKAIEQVFNLSPLFFFNEPSKESYITDLTTMQQNFEEHGIQSIFIYIFQKTITIIMWTGKVMKYSLKKIWFIDISLFQTQFNNMIESFYANILAASDGAKENLIHNNDEFVKEWNERVKIAIQKRLLDEKRYDIYDNFLTSLKK